MNLKGAELGPFERYRQEISSHDTGGGLYSAAHIKLKYSQSALHPTREKVRIFVFNTEEKNNNNASNYIERFHIPTVLMTMFTVCVTFVDSRAT